MNDPEPFTDATSLTAAMQSCLDLLYDLPGASHPASRGPFQGTYIGHPDSPFTAAAAHLHIGLHGTEVGTTAFGPQGAQAAQAEYAVAALRRVKNPPTALVEAVDRLQARADERFQMIQRRHNVPRSRFTAWVGWTTCRRS